MSKINCQQKYPTKWSRWIQDNIRTWSHIFFSLLADWTAKIRYVYSKNQMQSNLCVPCFTVVCRLFCLGIVAGIIIIALIPIYLPNNAVDIPIKTSIYHSYVIPYRISRSLDLGTEQFEVNYITNLSNATLFNVDNLNALNTQVSCLSLRLC